MRQSPACENDRREAVVASTAYLRRFGTPRTAAELDQHRLIAYSANPQMNRRLQERHRLPKIRACIDYWAQWLADLQGTLHR